jgi:hypothetical protein
MLGDFDVEFTITTAEDYIEYCRQQKYPPEVKRAWELYCRETAGDMHVVDFWEELPKHVQEMYLEKVK